MMKIAFYDAKPYDKEFFAIEAEKRNLDIQYFPFRLDHHSAKTATDFDAVCAFVNDKLDRECLDKLSEHAPGMIAMRCAGYNNIDVSAATELGFRLSRVPAYSPHSVAEHAVALIQTLNRRIHQAYNRVRELNFSLNGLVGRDLYGKKAAVMGTGKIGRITAGILRGFGMEVFAYDAYPDEEWARSHGVQYTSLEEILPLADLISLHLPLTAETHHIINEEALGKMKPGVLLVNTSRGKLIKTRALIQALKDRQVGGVALDVYEEEEGVFFEDLSYEVLQDDQLARLLTFPNVIITSHQAFLTREALSEIARVTCENLELFQRGDSFLTDTAIVPENQQAG